MMYRIYIIGINLVDGGVFQDSTGNENQEYDYGDYYSRF